MRVTLAFVPPGGGETDYQLDFELPAIPQKGDYIYIRKYEETGTCDFIVRRVHWTTEIAKTEKCGVLANITVECEFADSGMASESHKRCLEMYESRGKGRIEMEASVY